MLLATALALLLQDVLSRRLLFKQAGSSSTHKGNHHPSFLRFWNWAEENCRCSQICSGAENVVATETQQTFVNGLLGFITLGIYTPLEARIMLLLANCMSCPSIWATLSTLLINILLGSLQLFLHSDQYSLWGWNNPVQRVSASRGEAALSAGGGNCSFTHWLTDCFDMQPTTTSGNIITWKHHFQLYQLTPSCILHPGTPTSRLCICMSVIAAFASFQFSGIFVALGFAVMALSRWLINSPWRADDDADNQSGDNRGDSAHTSISLTVPPRFFEFYRLSALCSNWP